MDAPCSKAFSCIADQARVQNFLMRAVADGRVAHAYLFVGAFGSGQHRAARALAQSLFCSKGGCGVCDTCVRVMRGTHPDVHVCKPESTVGYLISQIRELIGDVALKPIRAQAKIYVIDRADMLRGPAANALLKTIEEPPENVHIILIAPNVQVCLPTLVSRCQIVPFRMLTPDAALAEVARRCGIEGPRARVALDVAITPEAACEFLSSSARFETRQLTVRTLGELAVDDAWDVLLSAQAIVKAAKAPLADVKSDQEAALTADADYLSAAALRKIEQRNKRELTAKEHASMKEVIAIVESLMRDVLMQLVGTSSAPINSDVKDVVDRIAARTNIKGVVAALAACSCARDDLFRNVVPQLTIESMFLKLKEALYAHSFTSEVSLYQS